MAKRRSEHRVVRMKARGPDWEDDMQMIEAKCDEMQREGWTLLTMSWPDTGNAVLMFTRPDRADSPPPDGGAHG